MTAEPHGGDLVDRVQEQPDDADDLPSIEIDRRTYLDLEMIAVGGYSPLEGFMTQDSFNRVVAEARLADGSPWGVPVTLTTDNAPSEEPHALTYDGEPVGRVDVEETWSKDAEAWSEGVYGTTELAHPGVEHVHGHGDHHVGGDVELYTSTPEAGYERLTTPKESRREFRERQWDSVVGFQTRNPPHRAHEYIQKTALENHDGLFVHPLVGTTKDSDVDAAVRMHAYEALLDEYYAGGRVALGTLKAPMRYAGPREALFHAVVRQNYGCTAFVVGRDHAGVGDYYGSYEAQDYLREFEDELDVDPLYFEYAFYCHSCDGMATAKTCPHPDDSHVNPSGTYIRRTAREGGDVSPKLMRPEVWEIVRSQLESQSEQEAGANARTGGATGGAS